MQVECQHLHNPGHLLTVPDVKANFHLQEVEHIAKEAKQATKETGEFFYF
jgi:hypothetical protein